MRKVYSGVKEILKYKNHTSIPVVIDDAGIEAVEGRKIVKAGTLLSGKEGSLISTDNSLAKVDDSTTSEGVLLYDVDVTEGPKAAAMVIRGEIDLNKIDKPSDEAIEALKTRILFLA